MKKFLICGALALIGLSFTACHDDDPDYNDVTPPEVVVAPNTLTGVVTNMQGDAVNGASVKLGTQTATTNSEGIYTFENVAEGTYEISASASGMVAVTAQITVNKSSVTQNLVWNATLAKENTKDVNVTVDGGGEGDVKSEALKNNEEGIVDISISIPKDVVPEDTRISITPIYTANSAVVSRADASTMLIGATLSCSDNNMTLSQDIDLKFVLDQSLANSVETKKYVNGQWVDAPSSIVDGNVVISAREFTSYGIFLSISVSTTETTEALVFSQAEWNNLYGSQEMNVANASFSYKVGTQVNARAANKLEGLLIEHLARLFGASLKTVQGTYPINVVLPIGTALQIAGAQTKTDITVSGNSRSVTGTSYGDTSVRVTTYNRNHNGGGSGSLH